MQNGKNIKLSIIIPTFNAAMYIGEAITCIAEQSFKEYEIIILDSLSTDNTLEIIKNNFADTTRLRIYSKKDEGIYYAMNKGISIAGGAWVYFMGADDRFVNPEVLKAVSNYFDKENDIVYGNVIWMPDNTREEGEWNYLKLLNQNINHQRIFYKKKLFLKNGDFNTSYKIASDHELNIRYFCNSAVIKKYIDIDIAWYNSNGFSANKVDEEFWENWKTSIRKNFSEHLPQKQVYASLNRYFFYTIDKKKYSKALKIFISILFHTHSLSFVKSGFFYFLRGLGRNSGS